MARSEARLAVTIWTDPDFLALSPTAQRMFMFLLSQPDLAHTGVLALRERRWSKAAAGLTTAQVTGDLEELTAARFLVVDEDTEELLIRSFIRRDKVYRQPNVLRAAADHLGVVTSPIILAAIAAELRRVATAEDIGEASASIIADMLAALEKGQPNPSANPSPDPSPKGSANPSAGTPGDRGVVTVVSRDSPSPVPRSSDPRPSPPATAREPRERRGTRIPDDFGVTPEMVEWAQNNTPSVDGRHETAKFIDYWRAKSGKDATKLDWVGTWRNWMRTAAERTGTPNSRMTGDNRHVDQLTPDQRAARDLFAGAARGSQVTGGTE